MVANSDTAPERPSIFQIEPGAAALVDAELSLHPDRIGLSAARSLLRGARRGGASGNAQPERRGRCEIDVRSPRAAVRGTAAIIERDAEHLADLTRGDLEPDGGAELALRRRAAQLRGIENTKNGTVDIDDRGAGIGGAGCNAGKSGNRQLSALEDVGAGMPRQPEQQQRQDRRQQRGFSRSNRHRSDHGRGSHERYRGWVRLSEIDLVLGRRVDRETLAGTHADRRRCPLKSPSAALRQAACHAVGVEQENMPSQRFGSGRHVGDAASPVSGKRFFSAFSQSLTKLSASPLVVVRAANPAAVGFQLSTAGPDLNGRGLLQGLLERLRMHMKHVPQRLAMRVTSSLLWHRMKCWRHVPYTQLSN